MGATVVDDKLEQLFAGAELNIELCDLTLKHLETYRQLYNSGDRGSKVMQAMRFGTICTQSRSESVKILAVRDLMKIAENRFDGATEGPHGAH